MLFRGRGKKSDPTHCYEPVKVVWYLLLLSMILYSRLINEENSCSEKKFTFLLANSSWTWINMDSLDFMC